MRKHRLRLKKTMIETNMSLVHCVGRGGDLDPPMLFIALLTQDGLFGSSMFVDVVKSAKKVLIVDEK
jgi:hypothetical protein